MNALLSLYHISILHLQATPSLQTITIPFMGVPPKPPSSLRSNSGTRLYTRAKRAWGFGGNPHEQSREPWWYYLIINIVAYIILAE